MPLASVAAQNASLDNDYGTTRGPNAPDAHELALFNGDPRFGGTELSGNGYDRTPVLPADWDPAEDGAKSATVTPADATGEWQSATHWLLIATATGDWWETAALDQATSVTAAGPVTPVTVTAFYGDG
jgi:hypothetical protein